MLTIQLSLIFALAVLSQVLAQGCWWTGCQANNWAVKGCAQYKRQERGKQACSGGHRYHCCQSGGSSGGGKTKPPGGGSPLVSFNEFRTAITSNGYRAPSQDQLNNFNKYGRSLGKISSKQEAAMALAQFLHESQGLTVKKEIACARTNCPNSYRQPGCDVPGKYYYGRGYIQLTGCDNYRAASQALFGDNRRLVQNPDQVASNDQISWQTSFWYWGSRVHGQSGVAQGRFGATTKAINGALECSKPRNPLAQKRFQIYGKVRKAFGLGGAGDPSGC